MPGADPSAIQSRRSDRRCRNVATKYGEEPMAKKRTTKKRTVSKQAEGNRTITLAQNESHLETFIELSAVLTGHERVDLLGTGVAQEYYDVLLRAAGQDHVDALLAKADEAGGEIAAVQADIWDDEKRFGPLARNIVLMWYLGSWYPLPDSWHQEHRPNFEAVPEHVVSAVAYQEALWPPTVGAHPRGAKPPGFGSWGEAPKLGAS